MYVCRRILLAVIVIFFCSLANADEKTEYCSPNVSDGNIVEGIWEGNIHFPDLEIGMIFNISQKDDGIYLCHWDSPLLGKKNIPAREVIYKDDQIIIRVGPADLQMYYEGTIIAGKSEIKGQWHQLGQSYTLDLKRDMPKKLLGRLRYQYPKRPYPYEEKEVIIESQNPDVKLSGTLTFNKSDMPLPGVLLISGSGPQDRDEYIMGINHRPFLVLADYLTRNGLAVLRVDDRGVGKSTGDFFSATSVDFAEDVLACVSYLKEQKIVDTNKIGLIGHSDGGLIASIVAAKSQDIAFVVLLASPGLIGEDILYKQGEMLLKGEGASEERLTRNKEFLNRMLFLVKNQDDDALVRQKMFELLNDKEDDTTNVGNLFWLNYNAIKVKVFLSPWFRYLLSCDPAVYLSKVKCPVLAINGGKDLQVSAKENLNAIAEALSRGGNSSFTMKEIPGLNHMFQTAQTGLISEYKEIDETFSPKAMDLIKNWILTSATKVDVDG